MYTKGLSWLVSSSLLPTKRCQDETPDLIKEEEARITAYPPVLVSLLHPFNGFIYTVQTLPS
jgi:hypothetical protein